MTEPIDIEIGQVVERKRCFSQEDFDRFATLSGDDNPIHVDPDFAARTKFGRPVAHGMLLYSALSGVISTRLPGPDSLPLEQQLKFPTATFVDEEVALRLEVTELQADSGIIDLDTRVIRPGGDLGLEGSARMLLSASGLEHRPEMSSIMGEPAPTDDALRHLRLGQRAESRRTFQVGDLIGYAALSEDASPEYAATSSPQGVPGALLGGMFSALLGTQLPGPGTNYLKQKFQFTGEAFAGDEITARVEINRIRAEKQLVNLSTQCLSSSGSVICQGEALVQVSDVI